jgi:hypothetical protein
MTATGCECPLAGHCKRHGINKPPHWVKLCQSKPHYFDAWEEGRGPGQVVDSRLFEKSTKRLEKFRALWLEFHSFAFVVEIWNPSKVECWVWHDFLPRVPSGGCGCQKHFSEILEANPPDYSSPETFFASTVVLHNLVNALPSVNKPQMSLQEARAIYSAKEECGLQTADL